MWLHRGRLTFPVLHAFQVPDVQGGPKSRQVILDNCKVLVLNRTAHLEHGSPSLQKLEPGLGRVDASRGQDREAGQSPSDGRDGPHGDGANGVPRHAAIRSPLLRPYSWPRVAVVLDSHQARHGVHSCHSVRFSLVGCLGNVNHIGDVRSELSEEGDLDGFPHPRANVSHMVRVLSTCKPHSPLSHSMRA
uniref:Uncharacterized protein n=1 Tax=Ixodes ricinus TaxID=34613 RepID=A0A6B0V0D4_IXORI